MDAVRRMPGRLLLAVGLAVVGAALLAFVPGVLGLAGGRIAIAAGLLWLLQPLIDRARGRTSDTAKRKRD